MPVLRVPANRRFTNQQYNLPDIGKKIAYRSNREGVAERFIDPSVQSNVAFDLKLIGFYDDLLNEIELEILRHAKTHGANSLHLLYPVPGIGEIPGAGPSHKKAQNHKILFVSFEPFCGCVPNCFYR